MSSNNPYDGGIVLALSGNGAGAYVDRTGATRTFGTLVNGTFTGGDQFAPGRKVQLVSIAKAVFAGGGSPTITLRLRGRRTDTANVLIFTASTWGGLYTARQDGITPVEDIAHVIDPADGLTQVIWLLTDAMRSVDSCEWSAESNGAPAAGDSIVVAVQP